MINSLPAEIICKIFTCLDRKSILNAGETCKYWNSLSQENAIWKRIFRQSEECEWVAKKKGRNWKACYIKQRAILKALTRFVEIKSIKYTTEILNNRPFEARGVGFNRIAFINPIDNAVRICLRPNKNVNANIQLESPDAKIGNVTFVDKFTVSLEVAYPKKMTRILYRFKEGSCFQTTLKNQGEIYPSKYGGYTLEETGNNTYELLRLTPVPNRLNKKGITVIFSSPISDLEICKTKVVFFLHDGRIFIVDKKTSALKKFDSAGCEYTNEFLIFPRDRGTCVIFEIYDINREAHYTYNLAGHAALNLHFEKMYFAHKCLFIPTESDGGKLLVINERFINEMPLPNEFKCPDIDLLYFDKGQLVIKNYNGKIFVCDFTSGKYIKLINVLLEDFTEDK